MSRRPLSTRAAPDPVQTSTELRLVLGRIVRRLRAVTGASLTASQLSALANLDEHGPLRLRDLARHEGIRPPTASRLIDPLVARGWVTRAVDPTDARGVLLALSDAGLELVERTRADRAAQLTDALTRLPAGDQRTLAAAVPVLHRLLAELPGPPAGAAPPVGRGTPPLPTSGALPVAGGETVPLPTLEAPHVPAISAVTR